MAALLLGGVKHMADIDIMAMEIPAPFVNQFQILVTGNNIRISFAEGFRGQPSNYRSAVVMSEADARDLAISILQNIQVLQQNSLTGAMTPHALSGISPIPPTTEPFSDSALAAAARRYGIVPQKKP
jgi:hypothetical protein